MDSVLKGGPLRGDTGPRTTRLLNTLFPKDIQSFNKHSQQR